MSLVGGRSNHYFKSNKPCVTYAVAELGPKALFTGEKKYSCNIQATWQEKAGLNQEWDTLDLIFLFHYDLKCKYLKMCGHQNDRNNFVFFS